MEDGELTPMYRKPQYLGQHRCLAYHTLMVKGHKTASEMAQKNYKAFLVEESEEPSHGEEPSQFRLTCSLESSVRL